MARNFGMTLVEVMIVVAIVAIVAGLAAPSLFEFIVRNRLDSGANEFATALNTARNEAMRRGREVAVRPRSGGTTFWDWTPGWTVDVAGSGELIREAGRVTTPMTLYMGTGLEPVIRFDAAGRTISIPDFAVFVLCHGSAVAAGGQSRSRGITVNDAGRVQLLAANSSGQPLKPTPRASPPGQVAITSCTAP